MTTQYSPILKLALPVQGELSGTWGDVVNDNITSMVEQAIAGRAVINTWTTNSHTLTSANGTTSESRCAMLELTDTGTALSGAGTVVCPTASKIYIVKNAAGQNITVKTSGGTGILVPNGRTTFLFCDGTNVVEALTHTTSLQLGTSTTVTAVLDEDNMASDSATSLATQQSIKAYVDAQVGANNELSEVLANGNTSGANDIIVNSGQKITTNTIDETTAGSGVTIDSVLLKDDVVNATDVETGSISANDGTTAATIANSTGVVTVPSAVLTTADINGGTADGVVIGGTTPAAATVTTAVANTSLTIAGTTTVTSILDEDNMASDDPAGLATQQSIKAYVDAQVGTVDTLAEVLANGNTTGGTDIVVSVDDVISLDNGTNALPSLTTTGDLNTGLYFPAADEVGITTGGTQRVKVDSTGVDITGTLVSDGLTVDGDGLFDSGTAKITVKSFQPKLILDDDSAGGAGSDKLIIQSVAAQTAGDYEFVLNNDQTSSADQTAIKISGNGDISFYDSAGSSQSFYWDTADERLGIGTTSPDAKLNIGFSGADQANSLRIEGSNGSSERYALDIEADGENAKTNFKIGVGGGAPTTRMTIDSSGNVGIGTSSPSFSIGNGLHIDSDGYTSINLQKGTSGGGGHILDFTDANNTIQYRIGTNFASGGENLLFAYGSTPTVGMTLDSSGNVGIGVVPDAWSGTGAAIQLEGTGHLATANQYAYIGSNYYYNAGWKYTTSSTAAQYRQDSGSHQWLTAASGTADAALTWSQDMTLDASGNLLVGMTIDGVTSTGIGLVPDGVSHMYSAGDGDNATLMLGRGGNDGNILSFNRSGVSVGSIGALSGSPYFAGTGAGIRPFANGIVPTTSTGASADGTKDLGTSGVSFRDLYLSNAVVQNGVKATTTATTQVAIETFAHASHDGAKVIITAATSADTYVTELLIATNGTTAVATEYGQIGTGSALATYDVDISGADVRILATPASTTSTTFRVAMTLT